MLRIVYLGTPEFAVEGLRALLTNRSEDYEVVAVVTGPDKPVGRGHHLQPTPVAALAAEYGIPTLKPERLRDEAFIEQLRTFRADLQIVVAFRMLPREVYAMPRLGTFNVHTSLLPDYRGAAPINWAVINGEKQTGLSTFLLDDHCDTGAILSQRAIDIADDECVGSVYDRLMALSGEILMDTLSSIIDCDKRGEAVPSTPQTGTSTKAAPKIFRETCELRPAEHTAEELRNLVRGLSPYPCAWTTLTLGDTTFENVKVYEAHCGNGPITLSCTDGPLALDVLQIPGKRPMPVRDLLNGLRL